MPPTARVLLACGSALALTAFGLALPLSAMATELPIDPMVGQYERALRRVQGQATTNPASAAREAARLRRQFIEDNRGVSFTPDRARIDRELQAVQSLGQGEVEPLPARPPAAEIQLPSTFQDEPDELPSMQREVRLVSQLLDRASQGIEERNPTQVTSDLAVAEASLAALRAALPPAETKPLADRLDGLRKQLASLPPDDGIGTSLGREVLGMPGEDAAPEGRGW